VGSPFRALLTAGATDLGEGKPSISRRTVGRCFFALDADRSFYGAKNACTYRSLRLGIARHAFAGQGTSRKGNEEVGEGDTDNVHDGKG
jgi:hypothetical protein